MLVAQSNVDTAKEGSQIGFHFNIAILRVFVLNMWRTVIIFYLSAIISCASCDALPFASGATKRSANCPSRHRAWRRKQWHLPVWRRPGKMSLPLEPMGRTARNEDFMEKYEENNGNNGGSVDSVVNVAGKSPMKMVISNGHIISKWEMFHCHVWWPDGVWGNKRTNIWPSYMAHVIWESKEKWV